MAGDKTLRSLQDRARVALGEDYEIDYWTGKFGVSRERLEEAVRRMVLGNHRGSGGGFAGGWRRLVEHERSPASSDPAFRRQPRSFVQKPIAYTKAPA